MCRADLFLVVSPCFRFQGSITFPLSSTLAGTSGPEHKDRTDFAFVSVRTIKRHHHHERRLHLRPMGAGRRRGDCQCVKLAPPRSVVRDGQTSPHRPRLVVSRSTCPPLSPSPHANSFIIGTAVIKTHTSTRRPCFITLALMLRMPTLP